MKYKYLLLALVAVVVVGISVFLSMKNANVKSDVLNGDRVKESLTMPQADQMINQKTQETEGDQEISTDTSLDVLEKEVSETTILEEDFSDLE